jgi:hypothetical protein
MAKNTGSDRSVERPATDERFSRRYDPAARRRGVRRGREKGCWVYIPAAELLAAGHDPDGPAPYYRTTGHRRSQNAGAVIVDLHREP